MRRAFEVKLKTFFLVSKVLCFRHAKQTSKNVADTTFNMRNIFLEKLDTKCGGEVSPRFVSKKSEFSVFLYQHSKML